MFVLKPELYLEMTLLKHRADKGDVESDHPKLNVYKRPGHLNLKHFTILYSNEKLNHSRD